MSGACHRFTCCGKPLRPQPAFRRPWRLKTVELARPVLFALVGCASDEIAVIERRERDATVHLGPGSVANDWREFQISWEPRPCALENRWLDSVTRCAAIERAVIASSEPFSWVVPPVRNWNTESLWK